MYSINIIVVAPAVIRMVRHKTATFFKTVRGETEADPLS
jgi:hypothetical protein